MHSMTTRLKTRQQENKKNPRFAMIIDTETTGLLPKNMQQLGLIKEEELKEMPYITQLSYIIYDIVDKTIVGHYDTYIKIPKHVEISEIVTKITGITREKCDTGVDIVVALNQLYDAYKGCDCIIAHNMWFDSRMIRLECRRHYKKLPYIKMTKIMFYNSDKNHVNIQCTMFEGTKYCSLKKWPRLANLYQLLFEEDIESYGIPLHNSLVDVLVCLRCYLKIYQNIEIDKSEFEKYIEQLNIKGT